MEASQFNVLVSLTKSGYVRVSVHEEKPQAPYIGRLVTRYNTINLYSEMDLTAAHAMSVLGRVARFLVREGEVK